MEKVLNSFAHRTQSVRENELELLLFRLNATQIFGIDTQKVREVVKQPLFRALQTPHRCINVETSIRGTSISAIDLRGLMGYRDVIGEHENNMIITEYNGSVQGFKVGEFLRVVEISRRDISSISKVVRSDKYLTGISTIMNVERMGRIDPVFIIDLEKILVDLVDYETLKC
ncbi:hypothetical protein FM037_11105 [Shewanella psychropiezotolerans]|uniref:CheW-like domain-containing protein n=1 Tax=Shewanella psychropiezotolerans TaxID=2593655 RepID=A0ABX5WX81_9GAMM|nr:chemotaxis protein CheW [Shewanella psychropiezotolerans]QDO83679.1 hypothetical protein FM037_11105 [Shewanella psychropiezotolerans]